MQQFRLFILVCLSALLSLSSTQAQPGPGFQWTKDGQAYMKAEKSAIVVYQVKNKTSRILITPQQLTPLGASRPLEINGFTFSANDQKLLIYTNAQKVWRYATRGDYWVLDIASGHLRQLGKKQPAASLMFAKFSPDGTRVAYVSEHNLYVERITDGEVKPLTTDGTRRLINGTFDWAYEEEFGCRDGFRWSPDGTSLAYWQIDATKIRDFLMINNTDSLYSFNVPVEYPKAGQSPSGCRMGVVDIASAKTTWMQVPGDEQQHYIPRMEWIPGKKELILQQLNRKQNTSKIMTCNAVNGKVQTLYEEKDNAWIDVKSRWDDDKIAGWDFIRNGNAFIWVSEKDGWRHVYSINTNGGAATLLTPGNYDVINIRRIDEAANTMYILASPENATQQYLYKLKMDGKSKPERITPVSQPGTHEYDIAPDGQYAMHKFSNYYFPNTEEIVHLPDHTSLSPKSIDQIFQTSRFNMGSLEFFQVTTVDGVTMDGWMQKPRNFDSTQKYPVVFYVYGEPAGATAKDEYGAGRNFLYNGDMSEDGYVYVSIDNRGTPLPKGSNWRKSIYRKVGTLNARDQAMAATELLKRPYLDASRVAVWGWSGGGSMTLNLLFQYPDIYQTGIAIAAVGNQLTYDNIYQERYMGLPQENQEDFVKGSPITYAKNLKGNLLYIHGTGDDNVHYQNAEMLINELVKYNRQFQLMSYPNRTHSLSEGTGTFQHLVTLYTNYLQLHCPPGGK
ncbi:S9 family peptidase [Chitinophaga defluvii]|uniref:DPP IV N-terminal domain-containing protein n=1 Tax=Chitinophaga defluvii TaxID=3163343 RepID=A0ABV2T2Q0_9BACT